MKKLIPLLFASFFGMATMAQAQVTLPAFFSNHMVLQQQSNAKIWGTAMGKKEVTVQTSWDRKTYTAKPDDKGNWSIKVATPHAGGPFEISVSQQNKIVLNDILIGEVWVCSGQSNMDMPVKGYNALPITNSLDLLIESPDPMLRLFKMARKHAATPETKVEGNWQAANAESVAPFSAAGYQFANYLRKHLGVPVGIIQVTWGGSAIEAWMDKDLVTDVLKERLATNQSISKAVHQTPGNLYNGMIAPLIGYHIAGVIWYQGEQNRHNYDDYLALQYAMVKSWREQWKIGDWAFYLAQLAPMRYPAQQEYKVPLLREAQLKLPDTLSNSGVAILIDAGEERNIHPPNKTIVAKRLAYLALSNTYQKKGFPAASPTYKKMVVKNDTVTLSFNGVSLGLTTYGKPLTQFEVAAADQVFYPATAILHNDVVRVYSDKVKQPVAVRYAFTDWCVGELYSVEGLPVSSFRTDQWKKN